MGFIIAKNPIKTVSACSSISSIFSFHPLSDIAYGRQGRSANYRAAPPNPSARFSSKKLRIIADFIISNLIADSYKCKLNAYFIVSMS